MYIFSYLFAHFAEVELYSRRTLVVGAKSSKSVAFIVTPKRVGSLAVKAVAASKLLTDSVEGTLLVEYPGSTEIVNRDILFGLESSDKRNISVPVRIPRNSIKESAKIEISLYTDLMGGILDNMENLIYQPVGSGEQAMIKFMPHLMVLKYLQVTYTQSIYQAYKFISVLIDYLIALSVPENLRHHWK